MSTDRKWQIAPALVYFWISFGRFDKIKQLLWNLWKIIVYIDKIIKTVFCVKSVKLILDGHFIIRTIVRLTINSLFIQDLFVIWWRNTTLSSSHRWSVLNKPHLIINSFLTHVRVSAFCCCNFFAHQAQGKCLCKGMNFFGEYCQVIEDLYFTKSDSRLERALYTLTKSYHCRTTEERDLLLI